jgi:Tfp pilus assembly protein PilV
MISKLTRKLWNESGLSLVEVLVSVSIMSFISLTIMGYFIQSVEYSAEDSRRMVAIKLAKQKIEQLQSNWADDIDAFKKLSIMNPLLDSKRTVLVSPKLLASGSRDENLRWIAETNAADLLKSERQINNVDYHFMIELSADTQSQYKQTFNRLTQGRSLQLPNDYLIKMRVIVYWGDEKDERPPQQMSTYLDSYVIFER